MLHFKRLMTESRDVLSLYDEQGNLIQKMFGTIRDDYSVIIPGNKVKMIFSSDHSVTRYGFEIDKIAFE